jgi:hypothetical protein
MKTNVSIELDDEQLKKLFCALHSKTYSNSKATRKDIVATCQQHIGGLIGQIEDPAPSHKAVSASTLYTIDPEDQVVLRGKPPGYVRGWNLVKRGAA